MKYTFLFVLLCLIKPGSAQVVQWQRLTEKIGTSLYYNTILTDKSDSFWCYTSQGVLKSADGVHWHPTPCIFYPSDKFFYSASGRLFAVRYTSGFIFFTDDDGLTWDQRQGWGYATLVQPYKDSIIAAYSGSNNGHATFTTTSDVFISERYYDSSNLFRNVYYTIDFGDHVLDFGDSVGIGSNHHSLTITYPATVRKACLVGNNVFAIAEQNFTSHFITSSDSGRTWMNIDNRINYDSGVSILYQHNSSIYLWRDNRFYSSNDSGVTFVRTGFSDTCNYESEFVANNKGVGCRAEVMSYYLFDSASQAFTPTVALRNEGIDWWYIRERHSGQLFGSSNGSNGYFTYNEQGGEWTGPHCPHNGGFAKLPYSVHALPGNLFEHTLQIDDDATMKVTSANFHEPDSAQVDKIYLGSNQGSNYQLINTLYHAQGRILELYKTPAGAVFAVVAKTNDPTVVKLLVTHDLGNNWTDITPATPGNILGVNQAGPFLIIKCNGFHLATTNGTGWDTIPGDLPFQASLYDSTQILFWDYQGMEIYRTLVTNLHQVDLVFRTTDSTEAIEQLLGGSQHLFIRTVGYDVLMSDKPSGITPAAETKEDVYVYPNPGTGKIMQLVTPAHFAGKGFQVADINGSVLLTSTVSGANTFLNFSGFLPGVYLLTINGTAVNGLKLVLQ